MQLQAKVMQTYTNFDEKPVLRSPCMRTNKNGCLFKPPKRKKKNPIKKKNDKKKIIIAQDDSSLALSPLPVYNQTVFPLC